MNDLVKVEKQARALMLAHGVGSLKFRFSKGTRQIGAVNGVRIRSGSGTVNIARELTLSRNWARVMPEEEILEIMLHEIAHALSIDEDTGHGPIFKATVRRLGGKATNRCFTPSVNLDGTPRKK